MLEPHIELQKSALFKYLHKLDRKFGQITIDFIKEISPLLESIHKYFPYYTRHDAHHSFKVLNRMSDILYTGCFKRKSEIAFTKEEALLLIMSAYAHDLGMAVFPGEEGELLNNLNIQKITGWETHPALQKYLRDNHSNRGGKYIAENFKKFTLPQNLIDILDKLMRAHNLSINQLEKQFSQRFVAGEQELDIKQLACILCIADAIEFSDTRVLDGVVEELVTRLKQENNKDLQESLRENLKNLGIGSGVGVGSDGKIIFSGVFDDPYILNLAHKTIDLIEEWIKNYNDIDYQSKLKRLRIRSDSVSRNLSIPSLDFERIGIRIKKDNIIDLISSNSTWTSDKAIVLRELLQNSVESCRYRQFHSSQFDLYKPNIKVFYSKKDNSVRVIDNGCGMSRNVILNNFLTVGNSRSTDPAYLTNHYYSLARFGIGFWSTFTIAQKVQIETAPFEYLNIAEKGSPLVPGLQFEIAIDEIKDYTVFKPILCEPGTKITIYLKEGISSDDIIGRIRYHLACSEIPIIFIDDDNYENDLPLKVELPSFENLFGSKSSYAKQIGIEEFNYKDEGEEFEIKIKFFVRKENGILSFFLSDNQSGIFSLNRPFSFHHRSVSICGFLSNFGSFSSIIKISNCGVFSLNVKNPKDYIFTLNRLSLMSSPKTEELIYIINKHVNNSFRLFLKDYNVTQPQEIYRLTHELHSNVESHHGIRPKALLEKIVRDAEDLLFIKLKKVSPAATFESSDEKIISLNSIHNLDYELWACNSYVIKGNLTIDFKKIPAFAFQVIQSCKGLNDKSYFVGSNEDLKFINDLIEEFEIHIVYAQINGTHLKVPVIKYFCKKSNLENCHAINLGHVQTINWTGSIEESEIHGSNFVFLNNQKIALKKGSSICLDLKQMLSEKHHIKASLLIKKLEDADQGFIDESIQKYL